MDHDETDDGTSALGLDATTAASLLQNGEQIGSKVYESIDFRTQALMQGGLAAVIFLYITVSLFLIGGQSGNASSSYGTNLLIPFLAFSALTFGARERLKAVLPTHRPKLASLVGVLSIVPFVVVCGAAIVGHPAPWWTNLAVAGCAAAPAVALSVFSARKMRHRDVRPVTSSVRAPLSSSAQTITVGLGIVLGATAASGAFVWGAVVGLVASIALLALVSLHRTRWSLIAVGSEWGRDQWLGFGISFALLMTATVTLARTPLNTPLVGIAGGIMVAVPLVLSTFRGSHIHERPEEFWDAPSPQS